MAKPTRRDDWGFPRWRPYGSKGSAAFETARRRYPPASFVPTTPSFLRNLGELGSRYRYRCGLASVTKKALPSRR